MPKIPPGAWRFIPGFGWVIAGLYLYNIFRGQPLFGINRGFKRVSLCCATAIPITHWRSPGQNPGNCNNFCNATFIGNPLELPGPSANGYQYLKHLSGIQYQTHSVWARMSWYTGVPITPEDNPFPPPVWDPPYPQPRPGPVPQPAPRPRPFPRPRPKPRPRPRPRPIIGPGPRPRPIPRPRPMPWRPPRPEERERKLRMPAWLIQALHAAYAATEFDDFITSLWDALPAWAKKGTTGAGRIRDVWNHWQFIDWEQAIANLILNEIEDQIIGRVRRGLAVPFEEVHWGPIR